MEFEVSRSSSSSMSVDRHWSGDERDERAIQEAQSGTEAHTGSGHQHQQQQQQQQGTSQQRRFTNPDAMYAALAGRLAAQGLDTAVLRRLLDRLPSDAEIMANSHSAVSTGAHPEVSTRVFASSRARSSAGARYLQRELGPLPAGPPIGFEVDDGYDFGDTPDISSFGPSQTQVRETSPDVFALGMLLASVYDEKDDTAARAELSNLLREQAPTAISQERLSDVTTEYMNTTNALRKNGKSNIIGHVAERVTEVDEEIQEMEPLVQRLSGRSKEMNLDYIRGLQSARPQQPELRGDFETVDRIVQTGNNRQRLVEQRNAFRNQADTDTDLRVLRAAFQTLRELPDPSSQELLQRMQRLGR